MQLKLRQVVTHTLSGGPTVLIPSWCTNKKSFVFINQIILNIFTIYFRILQKAEIIQICIINPNPILSVSWV